MQFRLLYKGPLPSAGRNRRAKEKQEIRRYLHPQLKELWLSHPGLGPEVIKNNLDSGFVLTREGYRFLPLVGVRKRDIGCRLNILFLRRGLPGDLVGYGKGNLGDIDNRLKVFFDGLKAPFSAQELPHPYENPAADEDPFFCLMADDNLITEIKVTSDRLLLPRRQCPCLCNGCDCSERDTKNENYVEIILDVETFVMDDGPYPAAWWG